MFAPGELGAALLRCLVLKRSNFPHGVFNVTNSARQIVH